MQKTTKQLGLMIVVMIMTVLSIILINFNQQNKLSGFTVQTYAEIGENPTGTPLTTVLLSITPPAISSPIMPGQPVVTEIKQSNIRTPAYFMISKDIRLEYDGSRYWFYREPSTTMQNTKVLYASYITNLPTTITGFDSVTENNCKAPEFASLYSPGDASIGRIGYYNKVTCFINENGIYGKAFIEEITKTDGKYARITTLEFGTSTSILPPTGGQYTVPCYKNTYEHIICKQTFTTTAAGKYTGSATPNTGWQVNSIQGYYSPSNPPVWSVTCATQPCTFTTTDYYANSPYISIIYLSPTTTTNEPPQFEAPFPEPPDCDADYPTPPAYAPPCDVFNINPSTNKARTIVNPILGTYTDKTTQYVQNLKISTQQRGGYIWKEGYRYDASINNWIRFTFDQPGYKGSNWILDRASTELLQIPLTAVRPDAPYANAILVFSCKKYGGKWRCGCTESDKTMDASLCEKWMMRQYTITLTPPPFAPPTPGGIATPAPTPPQPPEFIIATPIPSSTPIEETPPTPPPLPGNYVICRTPPGSGATITGITDPAALKSYCVDFAVLGDSSKTPMTGIDIEQALIGSKYTDAQEDKLECKLPCSHAKASTVKSCKDLTTNQYVFNIIDQCGFATPSPTPSPTPITTPTPTKPDLIVSEAYFIDNANNQKTQMTRLPSTQLASATAGRTVTPQIVFKNIGKTVELSDTMYYPAEIKIQADYVPTIDTNPNYQRLAPVRFNTYTSFAKDENKYQIVSIGAGTSLTLEPGKTYCIHGTADSYGPSSTHKAVYELDENNNQGSFCVQT